MIDVDAILASLDPALDEPGDNRWLGATIYHDHTICVTGCFRCDLSRDES